MPGEKIFYLSGIDTGIGKTIATGLLAGSCLQNGVKVITQKLVQTGCSGISEDIIRHRQLMEIDLQPVDHEGLTCPYIFSVPCSPHLAAQLENRRIDSQVIRKATTSLLRQYELVIVEGAGGLFVPLTEEQTIIDYFQEEKHPLILVSSSRLGSINHTLCALEVARSRNIEIAAIIYNRFSETDSRITADSRAMFVRYMQKYGFDGPVVDLFPLADYLSGKVENNFFDIFS